MVLESHRQRCIEVRTPASPCPFVGAPELIAQMLDKLLENALEFCPADGKITIALISQVDSYRLAVSNTGSRLPSGPPARLFDSMFSARTGSAPQPHFGLGLHVARLIVRRHNGIIDARNLPQGAGVEVSATFHRTPDAPV